MRVRVGGRIFEASIPSERFLEVKELVKGICRFDPLTKTWVFDPMKALCEDPSVLTKLFGVPEELIEKEMAEIRKRVDNRLEEYMNEGKFAFLPCDGAPPRFRREGPFAVIDLNEVSEIAAKEGPLYVLNEVIGAVRGYYREEHLERLREIVSLRREIVLRDGNGGMLITLAYPDENLVRNLEGLSTIRYYVKTLKEVQVRELRILRRLDERTYRGPYFLYHKLKGLSKATNFSLRDEVNWPDEEVPLVKDFKLYEFQRRAVDRWEENGRFGTVVLPTGAGKTYVGLEAIFRTSRSTLICVVTEELVNQWADLITRTLSYRPGVFTGKRKDVKPITVGIYNSVAKHIDQLYDKFALIVFDEVHHVPAATFKDIALRSKAKFRLGLSATPHRADGNHHLIFMTTGEVVFRMDYRDLMASGFIAPVRHHLVFVELTPEERGRMLRDMRFARREEERRMIERKYALMAKAKVNEVLRILEETKDRKILIFTEYVDQAEEIYRKLKEAGYRVELLIGKTTNRQEIFDRFRDGLINIIVTTRVLDEGIDVPDADVAIIVSGSGSKRQMIQRIGRVMRGAPRKVADVYEIVTKGTIEERLSRMRRRGISFLRKTRHT